jgi:hypothetical protein
VLPGSHKNNFGYNEVSEEIGHKMMYQSPQSEASDPHTPESGEGYYDIDNQLGYHQADGGQPVPPGVLNVCPKAGDVVVISERVLHGALRWRPRDRERRFLTCRCAFEGFCLPPDPHHPPCAAS